MKTIFTILAFLTIYGAQAQWTSDTDANTLVAQSGELDMQAKGTSDGQTYVVYSKNVAAPVNIELRMQVMDAEGNKKFGDDGMLVSDQVPMSTSTVTMTTTVDSNDDLYIGVTGTDGGNPAYVFKMDIDGNQLWGANGINVGNGYVVTVLPLSTGGAIVSWLADLGAVMQKYDETGTAAWHTTQPISAGSDLTSPANFFEISGGEYIAVFHKISFGINSFLYAQRYDVDGNPVWADAVQIADRATAYITSYTGVQDGDVVYMGYFASSGTRFDSYLQRIDPDGTLPWGINGSDFDTNETNFEMTTAIAFDPSSQYIWSTCNYTDQSQGQAGEYVQKFDKATGMRQFTDNAKNIFPIGSDKVHAGALQLKNDSPLLLIKDGFDNGATPVTLKASYLDENGDFAWPEETRPVATFSASKSRVQFTKNVAGQSVAVFTEDKGNGKKVYAQNIVDETAGVTDFSQASLFYANPVQNEMILQSDATIEAVSIYNTLGQQIFNSEYRNADVKINTQNWNSGIYFMNVITNKGMQKGLKFIKQ